MTVPSRGSGLRPGADHLELPARLLCTPRWEIGCQRPVRGEEGRPGAGKLDDPHQIDVSNDRGCTVFTPAELNKASPCILSQKSSYGPANKR